MLATAVPGRALFRGDVGRQAVMLCCAAKHSRGSKSVAVIGAGAAGLVAARELSREGHQVTVLEQGSQVGGVWVYTDAYEAEDLLGVNKGREKVHGSLYQSLRTNLPRHVMAYTDFPFDFETTSTDDNRLYCGHQEVLKYLQLFDQQFGISAMVQFNTRVAEVQPLSQHKGTPSNRHTSSSEDWPRWSVRTESQGVESVAEFDAVVVCNGHYSEPRVPELPGGREFRGKQLHTHNFRENGPFQGLRVVIMGASASGQDIAREIAEVADKVYFSARPMQFGSKTIQWDASDEAFGLRGNMFKRAAIASLGADGSVTFADGWRTEDVDVVVFATGYNFSFPFLEASGIVTVSDNRVEPLYQHVICTTHASLSFIGLPWQVIPFPLMELQSKWVARVLSGHSQLPSREQMEAHTAAFYREREAAGVPVRYSHRLGEEQWRYNAWLSEQIGAQQPQLPGWRLRMHKAGQLNIRELPDTYRDMWRDNEVMAEARRATAAWRSTPQRIDVAP